MTVSPAITVLIEDSSPLIPGLRSEHGLSLWIEAGERRILFDAGQSDALVHNAPMLGIDLAAADAVVLSHGHYDHTGGLSAVLDRNRKAPVYCHPDAALPRYSRRDDGLAYGIGMSAETAAALCGSRRARHVLRPAEIAPGVHLTGPVPRLTAFENTGGRFFLDPEGRRADPLEDDLSMWIETQDGIILICGCCHAGIVNTVRHVQKLRPTGKIRSIIGGLHLLNASTERLEKTIAELEKLRLERIVPCHCTGDRAVREIKQLPGDRITAGAAGMRIADF